MSKYNGHSFLIPKAGTERKMEEYSDEELMKITPALTRNEKMDVHSEFYYKMPAELPGYLQQALEKEMLDPSDAFHLNEYGKYMNNSGYGVAENGCCVLENGITYAAALIIQENRTDEMTEFYNQKFALTDSLFYKSWYPGKHYLHFPDGALEDFGFGRMKMKFMNQITPEQLGIRVQEIQKNDPLCIGISGTSAVGYNLDSNEPEKEEWNTIMMYHRMTENGRELRIRLWYGVGLDENGYHFTPPEPDKAEKIAKCTLNHIIHEYTNDQFLQSEFWKKYHKDR